MQSPIRKMNTSFRYGIMHSPLAYYRRVLKNVFWPPAFIGGVGASFETLEILMYCCGYKIGPAATSSQDPIFEMASMVSLYFGMFLKKIKVILSKIIYVLLLGLRLNF